MSKYDYGHFDNKQIKEIQAIQKEINSYGNGRGIVTADNKPRNIEGPINKEHIGTAMKVAKSIFNFFV
jgi:hypothetical protein